MGAWLFEIENFTMGCSTKTMTLLALVTLMTACGQTGPLYLPEPEVSEEPAVVAPAEPEQPPASADSATTQE